MARVYGLLCIINNRSSSDLTLINPATILIFKAPLVWLCVRMCACVFLCVQVFLGYRPVGVEVEGSNGRLFTVALCRCYSCIFPLALHPPSYSSNDLFVGHLLSRFIRFFAVCLFLLYFANGVLTLLPCFFSQYFILLYDR